MNHEINIIFKGEESWPHLIEMPIEPQRSDLETGDDYYLQLSDYLGKKLPLAKANAVPFRKESSMAGSLIPKSLLFLFLESRTPFLQLILTIIRKNKSMEKLSEEERGRIEKEAQNWWHTSPIITSEFGRIDAYKQGATAECLKKNEEIDKINEELRLYLEAGAILTKSWEGLQNEASELKYKLQASEERVVALEKGLKWCSGELSNLNEHTVQNQGISDQLSFVRELLTKQ